MKKYCVNPCVKQSFTDRFDELRIVIKDNHIEYKRYYGGEELTLFMRFL